MNDQGQSKGDPIWFLKERAKELNCLYRLEELFNMPDASVEEICTGIVQEIPAGWQYPDVCQAKITLEGSTFQSPDFKETPWKQSADIIVQDWIAGQIGVFYIQEMPPADNGPFLKEEARLLETIADRLGHFLTYRRMRQVFQEIQSAREDISKHKTEEWRVILNLLRRTDKDLFLNICWKMLNQLSWKGIVEAEELLRSSLPGRKGLGTEGLGDDNRPLQANAPTLTESFSTRIFEIAPKHLSHEQILFNIQKWIQEDRLSFLLEVVSPKLPLAEVKEATRRYCQIARDGVELPPASKRGVQVSLIRRFLSDQLHFINIAKGYVEIEDFQGILDKIVCTPESHGKLGGKSAGLFLAWKIIQKSQGALTQGFKIKVPKTWYLASDGLLAFFKYNNLSEVVEQKYKDINQVRLEYPHIIQTFKSCPLPPEIVQGLSMLLDDFGEQPLIVRSSSLLEDRMGAAFSGKYKSLFIANRGSKEQRLAALTDAISEVYASTFGPDPIEYRAERSLLDFHEEMGILIQEVVGARIGEYFLPSFAGVAFSRNDFRWSPRIQKQDGLARLVPGLGTRAVDRVVDDYPILIAPGQPGLRVNVTVDEVVRYSPKHIDVINLKTNAFETIRVEELLKKCGPEIRGASKILSIYDGLHIRKPLGTNVDFERDNLVVTFEGLINDTPFVKQLHGILKLLEEKLQTPVDIEFAFDGEDFYLLQCRPQSYSQESGPAPIPKDLPKRKVLFTAKKHVSNGKIPNITHIVYVDPQKYGELAGRPDLLAVGRAVSKLNKLLPKRQFILMGPGRWGSRGDIKLGVNVTYSDINNTALLIEIARKKGNYVPDLSFGTHFFQDLVEAQIRYLPLYPDDKQILFNEHFFTRSPNILPEVLPEFAFLADAVRLIDVPKASGGLVLQVLMNGELDEAVGILAEFGAGTGSSAFPQPLSERQQENFWLWRLQMAEKIAAQIDPERFGVKGIYIFGSTKNATAGPCSDIDLLIHFQGSQEQRRDLLLWLEGWSRCLDEINYLRTGYRTGGLLDVQFVTDEDIAKKTSYAVKIGAVTDAAKPLPLELRKKEEKGAEAR